MDEESDDSDDNIVEQMTAVKRKPAWVDKHASTLKVSINEVSRLRKLMKTEDEAVI